MVSDWYHGISDDVVLSSCISWHRASLINTNVHHQYRFLGRNRSLGRGLRPSVTDLLPVLLSVVIPVGYGRFGALHVTARIDEMSLILLSSDKLTGPSKRPPGCSSCSC